MAAESVIVTHHGRVTALTIDRPAVSNALDGPTLDALYEGLFAAHSAPQTRAVVITATGDRAFSAGLDLAAMARDGVPDPARSPVNLLRSGSFSLPVIAAINGAAIGGGFELALACDLRLAAEHAVFALPEVGLGLAPTEGGTDLPVQIPLPLALEMGLTGCRISADRARQIGLVNHVTSPAETLLAALEMAHTIAQKSPAAVQVTKRLMYDAVSSDAATRRGANAEATAMLLAGPDAAEGPAAFREGREPHWADAPRS